MGCIVECRHFGFAYGQTPVLQDLEFCLPRGEWLSVIGPNGSGKSSLLKCLLRLVTGRKWGQLLLESRPQARYGQRQLARLFAYVPQGIADGMPYTVEEFLQLSTYSLSGTQEAALAAQYVGEALQSANLSSLAQRRLDELSGGQRQRALIAAALAQGTRALLLDEPCAFLDPGQTCAVEGLLEGLHRHRGLTVIMVTHDLSQSLAHDGLALVLRDGRQQFFGPAAQLPGSGILEKTFCHEFSYLAHPKTGRTLVIP